MSLTATSHSTSLLIGEDTAQLVAKAQFHDFAPAPCVCYGCFIPEAQKKRTFVAAYTNKYMTNYALSPCCCFCDDEKCMVDMPFISFYDKPPTRVGMCCFCIPLTCCGPPVIFSFKPKCLCMDMDECCGTQIKAAPCNCFGLKCCLCFGNPCYTACSVPIARGIKDADTFLAQMKGAVNAYGEQNGIPLSERAIFESVSDNVDVFGGSKGVSGVQMNRN